MTVESAEVTVRCPNCSTIAPVPAATTEFACESCGQHFRFLRCPRCGDSAQVSDKLARRNKLWLCPSCRLPVRNPHLRMPVAAMRQSFPRLLSRFPSESAQ